MNLIRKLKTQCPKNCTYILLLVIIIFIKLFFEERFNLWDLLLINISYHSIKTPIDFNISDGLNSFNNKKFYQ